MLSAEVNQRLRMLKSSKNSRGADRAKLHGHSAIVDHDLSAAREASRLQIVMGLSCLYYEVAFSDSALFCICGWVLEGPHLPSSTHAVNL